MKKHADYMITCTGTGGTMAGLAAGREISGGTEKLIGIQANAKDQTDYKKQIAELGNEALKIQGLNPYVTPNSFEMDDHYYLSGYEMPNEEANQDINCFPIPYILERASMV